jgi:hypothetical protein
MKSASWKELPGKKTYHLLNPAMLRSKQQKPLETRLVPFRRESDPESVLVSFDRSYALEKVRRDLTLPLKDCELRDILELVVEAWGIDHPEAMRVTFDLGILTAKAKPPADTKEPCPKTPTA